MDVKVKFLGGAGSVTGSRYLVSLEDFRFLLDCGLFQGLKPLRLRNWDEFPIDPKTIDATQPSISLAPSGCIDWGEGRVRGRSSRPHPHLSPLPPLDGEEAGLTQGRSPSREKLLSDQG